MSGKSKRGNELIDSLCSQIDWEYVADGIELKHEISKLKKELDALNREEELEERKRKQRLFDASLAGQLINKRYPQQ